MNAEDRAGVASAISLAIAYFRGRRHELMEQLPGDIRVRAQDVIERLEKAKRLLADYPPLTGSFGSGDQIRRADARPCGRDFYVAGAKVGSCVLQAGHTGWHNDRHGNAWQRGLTDAEADKIAAGLSEPDPVDVLKLAEMVKEKLSVARRLAEAGLLTADEYVVCIDDIRDEIGVDPLPAEHRQRLREKLEKTFSHFAFD